LTGIRLYAANDGQRLGLRRSMSRFQFFADVDQDGVLAPSERLVDQSVNTNYNAGQAGDLDTAENEIEFAFAFPTTTARRWSVVVTQGVNFGPFDSVRVQEVDGLAAPVATTLVADPPVQGLLTLRGRLTETLTGTPVAGQTLVMTTSTGTVCQAVTADDGSATCSGLGAVVQLVAENGYTASFAGAGGFLPSSARATFLAPGSGSSVTTTVPTSTPTSVAAPAPPAHSATGTLAATGGVRGVEEWGLALLLVGAGGWATTRATRCRAPGRSG
jgi:hypothetical protein